MGGGGEVKSGKEVGVKRAGRGWGVCEVKSGEEVGGGGGKRAGRRFVHVYVDSYLYFNFSTGFQSSKKFSTRSILSAINITRALLRLISVTVFNFTHPPVLSALLLILSDSRFLAPDSPLLFPAPFLFSVHQHGMTFTLLSDRNPLWTHSNVT